VCECVVIITSAVNVIAKSVHIAKFSFRIYLKVESIG